MTPVLKPLPSAGQGEWDFQSLPGKYQSLWLSARPRASELAKSWNIRHNWNKDLILITKHNRDFLLRNS